MSYKADLQNIPVSLIERNPENPRIFFRQEEMEQLYVSIKTKGLLVPISVYEDSGKYVIIDGERRWRTFLKLNYDTIPAIIQDKPSPLDNLLLMFNIHGLREQWDIYTIAMKIERVVLLLSDKLGYEPTEIQVSEETGMTRGVIRRCKMIIALPERFKEMLRVELEKPKKDQLYSEDFFLEMESSLKSVKNNYPETIQDIDIVRDVLIEKYLNKIINNVVDFRKLTKIATAWNNVGFSRDETIKLIELIFSKNEISIAYVYAEHFEVLYGDRAVNNSAKNFLYKLDSVFEEGVLDETLRSLLSEIKEKIDNLLNR
ncbi:MAG: ParB/RepB/Spo0J family partition protein [Bacteroidota bacterium]